MSTLASVGSAPSSFISIASQAGTEPGHSLGEPQSRDSRAVTESTSVSGAPRPQDGQLRQARFESAAARQKRDSSSAGNGQPAEAPFATPGFPQKVSARKADEKLQQTLTHWLITGEVKDNLFPRNASIRPFIDLFNKAAREPQVQAWFKSTGLDLSSVRVFSDGVEGNVLIRGRPVKYRFTVTDGSGWNEVGAKLTEAANKLQVSSAGVLLPQKGRFVDLDVVFNFYGVEPPHSDQQKAPLGELLKTAGWPVISDEKRYIWHQRYAQLLQEISDIDARSSLATQLRKLVKGAVDADTLSLGDRLAVVRPEATLAQKSQEPREHFAALLALPPFKTFIEKAGYGGTDQVYRVFDGGLQIRDRRSQWFSLDRFLQDEINKVRAGGSPNEKQAIETLDVGFRQLLKMCKPIGNTLYSQPLYDARQYLAFSGLGSPRTLAQVYAAISGLSENLPPAPTRWTLPSTRPQNPNRAQVDARFGKYLLSAIQTGYALVKVPEGTSLAGALDIYRQVLAQPDLQTWIKSKGLETEGLELHRDSISGYVDRDGVRTAVTFSTADDSGWWQVSQKLRLIRDVLDPADEGIYYLAEGESWLPAGVVAQAYGLGQPDADGGPKQLMAQLQAGELVMPADQYQRINTRLEHLRQTIGDLDERAYLADYLERKIGNSPDEAPWDWSEHAVLPSAYSPLVAGDHAARASLQRLTESPALRAALEKAGLFWEGQPFRVSEGTLQHQSPDGHWLDLTSTLGKIRGLEGELRQLIELGQSRGQALYSVPTYDVRQLLDHKGLGSPRTVGETRNVVRWLRSVLPPAPVLGNYFGLMEAPWSPGKLTADDKVILKAEARRRLGGHNPRIVDYLKETSLELLKHEPTEHLEKFLNSQTVLDEGDDFARILKWHARPVPKAVRQQLALAALTLHAEVNVPATPGHIAGYALYKPSNMGRTFNAVRRDIEKHLHLERGLDPKLAVLVAQVGLAQVAPEFLIRDVPKEIVIGTPAWMELRLGAAMAELKAPGTSRMMNEQQISDLTTLAPTTEDQATLMQLPAMKILLDWAVLNGVIAPAVGGEHPVSALKTASAAFFKQRQEVNNALNAVAELPARKAFAIRELLNVFPGTTRSELETMKVVLADSDARRNTSISEPRARSLIETYMTGDLTPGKWVLSRDIPERLTRPRSTPFQMNLAVEAPAEKRAELDERIGRLPALKPLLKKAVDAHTVTLKTAYATQLKLMFAKLPLADRQLLDHPESVVTLFTVRGETGLPPATQTDADVEAVRGRQGTLMRVELGKQASYFEVFANGKITKRTDLPQQLREGDVLKGKPNPLGLDGIYIKAFTGGFKLNVDLDAYLKGGTPRPNVSSTVIIDRIGTPIEGVKSVGNAATPDLTDTYSSPKIHRIAALIADKNLYEGDEQMLQRAEGTLPLEIKREALVRDKAILKGLVPFLGAYQEFSDGNIGSGLFALSLDIGGLIIGAGGQVRSLLRATKTLVPNPLGSAVRRLGSTVAPLAPRKAWAKPVASFSDRAFNFIKESALLVNGVMNPADGYAQLTEAAVKGVFKLSRLAPGASMLGKASPHLITIEEKLRAYWLAGGWDSAPAPRQSGQAGTSQGVAVVASRVSGVWYALNPETGKPDGTPLSDFNP